MTFPGGGVGDNPEFKSVSTDQGYIASPTTGPISNIDWERPEIQTTDKTVQVPQDESTIQDALRKVPWRLFGNYFIEVDPTEDTSSEDIIIPPVYTGGLGDGNQGLNARIKITSQSAGTHWDVNSIVSLNAGGIGHEIVDAGINGVNPWDNEDGGVAVYGGGPCKIDNLDINSDLGGGAVGVLAYGSRVHIGSGTHDFGTDNVDVGFRTKWNGLISVQTGASFNGQAADHGMQALGPGVIRHGGNTLTGATTDVDDPNGFGGTVSKEVWTYNESSGSVQRSINLQADGDMEYRDGSGTARITMYGGAGTVFAHTDGGKSLELNKYGTDGKHVFNDDANTDMWYTVPTGGVAQGKQRSTEPTTGELDDGDVMLYVSDGSPTGSEGDLIYAINDAGTIKTAVVQAVSGAS